MNVFKIKTSSLNKTKALMVLVTCFALLPIAKADFQRIKIPGAYCGDGKDYHVYFQPKSEGHLLVEFMGGGACWNFETCFGPRKKTILSELKIQVTNYLVKFNPETNPLTQASFLFFPYCTGDAFLGEHIAEYQGPTYKKRVFHVGHKNVQKAIHYLTEAGIINTDRITELNVLGSSAGAMATLNFVPLFNKYFPQARKALVADSPGLHWSSKFWQKFSANIFYDFAKNIAKTGVQVDIKDGNIGKQFGEYCDRYWDWKIGFIQATRDYVMSEVFDDIGKAAHEKLFLGPQGLPHKIRGSRNCSVWFSKSEKHTFLLRHEKEEFLGENSAEYSIRVLGDLNSMLQTSQPIPWP